MLDRKILWLLASWKNKGLRNKPYFHTWYLTPKIPFLVLAFTLIFPNIYHYFFLFRRFKKLNQYWDLVILVAWFASLGNFNTLFLSSSEQSCVLSIILCHVTLSDLLSCPLLKCCMLHRLLSTFTMRRKQNVRRLYGNIIIESILRYQWFNSFNFV